MARACNARVTGAVRRISRQVSKETSVDLVDAFANIGLPDSTPERNGTPYPVQSAPAPLRNDYALTADHLRGYYIMSRGRNAEASSDAS